MGVKNFKRPSFKYRVGQTVALTHSRYIGLVLSRYYNPQGLKFYDVVIGRNQHLFYENEISPTSYRMCGEVEIKELFFDDLSEGEFCLSCRKRNL